MAYFADQVFDKIYLYTVGRKQEREPENLLQHDDRFSVQRDLAWCKLDVCFMGSASWCGYGIDKGVETYGEWIPRILKRSVTLLFINFTWIIFRTADLKELREVFRAFLKGGISINPDLFQFFGIAGKGAEEYTVLYSILVLLAIIGFLVFLLIAPNAKEAAEK